MNASNEISYQKTQAKTHEVIDHIQPKRILEIGCGVDPIFKFYNNYELFTVVEPSDFFVETAKKEKNNFPNKKIKICQGFVENVIDELVEDKYDLILLSGLLHEVKDPQGLIVGIKKLMENKESILEIIPKLSSANIEKIFNDSLDNEVLKKCIEHADSIRNFYHHDKLNIFLNNPENRVWSIDRGLYIKNILEKYKNCKDTICALIKNNYLHYIYNNKTNSQAGSATLLHQTTKGTAVYSFLQNF